MPDRWRSSAPARAATGVGSLALLYLVIYVVLRNHRPPPGEVVFGALIGLLYALVAFGLILVYRANRIINFAQAEIGGVAAMLGVLLIKIDHVPFFLAFGITLAAGGLTGVAVDRVIVRRFARAPRLVLSVATIGVALLLGIIQFYLPKWMGAGFSISPFPPRTPFSGFGFSITPLHFDGNAVAILLVSVLVLVGLTAFFKRSDIGIAVRAVAENSDRARLLGISVTRLSSVVWLLSGALSAVGIFLRIPIVGLPVGSDIGPQVLLFALAAAVIAKMESFPVALVAGVGIGICEQCLSYFSRNPDLAQVVMLPVLLVAMLAQSRNRSRGRDSGLATWTLAAEFRPIPPELRKLPEVKWARVGLGVAVVGSVLALPYLVGLKQQELSSVVVLYAIVAVSIVILTGWAGQISLGQWGFAGVGSAVASGVAIHLRHTWFLNGDFFVALLLAGVVGAVTAVLIGLPALRLQGLYLAVTTLAFALAVQVFVLSPNYFGWLLPNGFQEIQPPILYGKISLAGPRAFYFFCLLVLVACLLSARAVRRSRTGRLLIASRDNERGAASYGISVKGARLAAFAMSGFWAAVAGGLFAYQEHGINVNSYGLNVSYLLLTLVVIGGLTSLPGALLGAAYFGVLEYGGFSQQIQALASGVGVLLLLMFIPGGLAQIAYSVRDGALRRLARRRGLVVPSLLADVLDAPTAAEGEAGSFTAIVTAVASQGGRIADGSPISVGSGSSE